MLPINIMRIVVDAFDQGRSTIGDDLIKEWEHDSGSLKFAHVSSNFIYQFTQNNQLHILRIAHESRRTLTLVQAELDFMDFLRIKGIRVPRIVSSISGHRIVERQSDDGSFFATVFEGIEGSYIEYTEMNDSDIYEWGRQLGLLHVASIEFKNQPNYQRFNFQEDVKQEQHYLKDDSNLQQLLDELLVWMEALSQDSHNYGLIHYDLEEDNLLWEQDKKKSPYIIDFDDSAYHFYMADIAFALEDIRELPSSEAIHFMHQFLCGYQSVKSIPEVSDWKDEFKRFNLLMDLLKIARTIRAYDQTDATLDSDWVARMRKRHMGSINDKRTKFTKEWSSIEKYCKSLNWVDQVDI